VDFYMDFKFYTVTAARAQRGHALTVVTCGLGCGSESVFRFGPNVRRRSLQFDLTGMRIRVALPVTRQWGPCVLNTVSTSWTLPTLARVGTLVMGMPVPP
jgi:hypothetical protein